MSSREAADSSNPERLTGQARFSYIMRRRAELGPSSGRQIAQELGLSYDNYRNFLYRAKGKYSTRLVVAAQPRPERARAIQTVLPAQTPPARIIRGQGYGSIPATGYVSVLSHDEWANQYCNHKWKTEYLTVMSHLLWNNLLLLVFLPRGHGKTWRVIALITRWILEKRLPVLVLTGGPANQRRIFRKIRALLKSPKIRQDYGDIIESFNATTCEMVLVEELQGDNLDPVLRVAPRGAEIAGSHPAWIHNEDLIQQPFKGDESNEALFEWWCGIVEFCAVNEPGKETRITGTGTKKDIGDFYELLEEQLRYPSYKLKAIELVKGRFPDFADVKLLDSGEKEVDTSLGEYKTLNCPAWPLQKLLTAMIFKPERFRAEMQNDPLPKGGLYFSMDHWIEIDDFPGDNKRTTYYISVDPSFGKKQKADYTAILVCAVFNSKVYLVDGKVAKVAEGLDSDMMINELIRLSEEYQPRAILIESNNFQFLIAKQLTLRNVFLPVHQVENVTKKIERINSLKPYFVSGLIICCNCQPRSELKREYQSYDQEESTASRKDDALDALEMIMRFVTYHLREARRGFKYGF